MCGICGIYGVEDRALIQSMLSVMKHRGPDGEGIFIDSHMSLGHTRLSIIDLSEKGQQPMSNEEGDVWLSVNGEIYNFKELRRLLDEKGHEFYSQSDSEVILHAYEEYGLDFIHHLRGMFAFALYDTKERRLILARDPIGKKPLYYCLNEGALIFASEIKAILESGIKKEIELDALCAYLAYQYSLGKKTLFKGIKKILAGTMLILEPGNLRIQKYWDLREGIVRASESDITSILRALLEESTKLRMVADVPIGAFLSGGIDSSAVVALARPYVEDEFHTFSVGFESFSELEYAKIVSEHLDTVHHELVITSKMVERDLPRIAWYYDEPLGDAAIINTYYMSMIAQKYVKVVLAGEGGDELFAGYPRYAMARKLFTYYKLSSQLRRAAEPLVESIPAKGDIYAKSNRIHELVSKLIKKDFETVCFDLTKEMTDAEVEYLVKVKCADPNRFSIDSPKMIDPLNKMLALDSKNLLPERYLMKADKGTMANSIEERLPLLDKELIRYAFSIPPPS